METKKYKLGEFWNECQSKGLTPPEDIMMQETELFLQGEEFIEIPLSIFDEMYKEKERQDKRDSECQEISSLRLAGIEKEKCGDVEGAISNYARCIEKGENADFDLFHSYLYAYKRIIVLLRKTKNADREIFYITSILKHALSDRESEKYTKRLNELTK